MEGWSADDGGITQSDPHFGSNLLHDDFGQRQTEVEAQFINPSKLEIAGKADNEEDILRSQAAHRKPREPRSPSKIPLHQEMGATHMFNNMHGVSTSLEGGEDNEDMSSPSKMRPMTHLTTAGRHSAGTTDWGTGTDGGKSNETNQGVPYGSFAGV